MCQEIICGKTEEQNVIFNTKVFFHKNEFKKAIKELYQDQFEFNVWKQSLDSKTQNTVREIVYVKNHDFEQGVTDFCISVVLIKSFISKNSAEQERKLDRFVLVGDFFEYEDVESLETFCSQHYENDDM